MGLKLGLIDVAGLEDAFRETLLCDADHGAAELFGGDDVVCEEEL